LAMVEWVATGTRGSEADGLAQCLADGAAPRLGRAGESPAGRVRGGGHPAECAAGTAFWGRRLGQANGEALRDGGHVTVPWTTERVMK
jgi:hypothetical protein